MPRRAILLVLVLLSACDATNDLFASSDSSKDDESKVTFELRASGGGGQVGFVGTALAQSVTAKLIKKSCKKPDDPQTCSESPVSSALITWRITAGGGTLSATTVSTNASGDASVQWTLGTLPGAGEVEASFVSGDETAAPLLLSATAIQRKPMLELVSGGGQVGPQQTALAQPIVVKLTDITITGARAPLANVTVTWSTTNGSTSATTSTTDAAGVASTTWTLGASAGAQVLTASVAAVPLADPTSVRSVDISATAQVGPARVLRIVSGNAQQGAVGRPLVRPIVVEFVSINPVNGAATAISNTPVSFTPAANNGTAQPTSIVTDAQGQASIVWTLGPTVIPHAMTVSTPAVSGVDPASVFSVNVSAVAEPLNIVFSDNFDVGNQWQVTTTTNDFGAWAATRTILTSDGNPGAFARMNFSTILTTNPTFASVFVRQVYTGGTYTPSLQGAIASIDYAVDRRTDQGVYDAFVLMQNGVEYRAEFPGGSVFSNVAWGTSTLVNLQSGNFSRIGSTGPANPNFTASGGPIQFGFTRGATQRFAGFSNTHDIDDFTVTIKR